MTAPRPAPRRALGALAALAVGLAAAGAVAGPTRPDAPEGPKSLARTLGNYAVAPGQALARRDLPTLAGADPADAEAAAEDRTRRLAEGLIAEAGEPAADTGPDATAGAGEIVLASLRPERTAATRHLLGMVLALQNGPAVAMRPPPAARGAGVSTGAADGTGPSLDTEIDPGGYLTAANTGPGGLLALVMRPPDPGDTPDRAARDRARAGATRLAADGTEPRRIVAQPAGWLTRAAGGVRQGSAYPAYLGGGAMLGAVLVLLVILRGQLRRRRRRR